MKKGIFLNYLLLVSLFSISCKKHVIIVPEAKMYADKTSISKGDTVTFTNASIADYSAIYIAEKGKEFEGTYIGYSFEQHGNAPYKHVFSDVGYFSAVLRVNNAQAGSPIKTFIIPITVYP